MSIDNVTTRIETIARSGGVTIVNGLSEHSPDFVIEPTDSGYLLMRRDPSQTDYRLAAATSTWTEALRVATGDIVEADIVAAQYS